MSVVAAVKEKETFSNNLLYMIDVFHDVCWMEHFRSFRMPKLLHMHHIPKLEQRKQLYTKSDC